MTQKQLKKLPKTHKAATKRANAPTKTVCGENPAARKLRPGKKVVGIRMIEGQLAGLCASNNGVLKLVKPTQQQSHAKKLKH